MTSTTFLGDNKNRFIDELIDFLKIPSISADPDKSDDMAQAAEWLECKLAEAGIEKTKIFATEGHPIVYAEKRINDELPTVLVYGHYDVQPPEPLELWESPPFEPKIKNQKIYARGACDDKGQMYMHVKALETLITTKNLPCNVKVLIEGEEEVGSSNLEGFLRQHTSMLSADVILISDTSIISNDCPSITSALRGISYIEVELKGPSRDLHSGVYGGAIANPINTLTKLIANLTNDKGKITLEGFYDDVAELTTEQREKLNREFNLEAYKKELGIKDVFGESGFNTLERTGIRPSLDVNGIWGGYTGVGAKTVLPSKANAKISCRLVPNQSSDHITSLLKDYFESNCPKHSTVEVTVLQGGEPIIVPTDSPGYMAAELAFQEVWGKKPVPTREGGSIPIVAMFKKVLGLDSIMMGFGLDSDAIHSPNESFGIFNYLKGIETITVYYQKFTKLYQTK